MKLVRKRSSSQLKSLLFQKSCHKHVTIERSYIPNNLRVTKACCHIEKMIVYYVRDTTNLEVGIWETGQVLHLFSTRSTSFERAKEVSLSQHSCALNT